MLKAPESKAKVAKKTSPRTNNPKVVKKPKVTPKNKSGRVGPNLVKQDEFVLLS